MTSPLILLGYMGCGKTKIGKRLSKKLSIEFIDLDQKIESLYSKTISQLFNDFGEIGFREIERKILLKIFRKRLLMKKSKLQNKLKKRQIKRKNNEN